MTAPAQTELPALTPRDVAKALGVSDKTVRRWIAEGRVAGVRIGGRLRVAPEALEILIRPAGPARDELR
jgi:excisionase family DNA binding protein